MYSDHRYLLIIAGGFSHSDISGSTPACGSPKLIAANHVLHRLLAPRHPPCALSSLTITTLGHVARFARPESGRLTKTASLPILSFADSSACRVEAKVPSENNCLEPGLLPRRDATRY